MKHNLQRELEGELNTANHTLEMVIDKYDMVLYDFCTNDEIINWWTESIGQKSLRMQLNCRIRHSPQPYLQPECRSGHSGIRYGLLL